MARAEEGNCHSLMSSLGIQALARRTGGQLCEIGMFGVILYSPWWRLRSTDVVVVVRLEVRSTQSVRVGLLG